MVLRRGSRFARSGMGWLGGVVLVGAAACESAPPSAAEPERLGEVASAVEPDENGTYCMETCVPWGPDYDLCRMNCHHAANAGLEAGNDGILNCTGAENNALGGHAAVWDEVECTGDLAEPTMCFEGEVCPVPRCFCVAEPQSPGSPACCWQQADGSDVDVGSGEGHACAMKICGDGATPVANPAGQPWDNTYTDPLACSENFSTKEACHECCGQIVAGYLNMKGLTWEMALSILRYGLACGQACGGLPPAPPSWPEPVDPPPPPEGAAPPAPTSDAPPTPEPSGAPVRAIRP